MTSLTWLVVLAAGGYLGGLAVLFFAQRSLVFPIPQTVRTVPGAAGIAQAEEHILTTSDGEKVIVWHVPAKPKRAVVVYFHGNGDVLAALAGHFRSITADGTGLVALSYRGYAGSSGRPSERGLLRDAAAAYAFAAARYGAERMVLWGFSLGSGVAVAMAADRPVAKVILEAPYTSLADVAASLFRFAPVRWLMRDPFRSDQRIARVTAPLLVMHGGLDATIPIRFGERLFALANEPKQFVRFGEASHNDLASFGAIEAARRFIDAALG
jgi:fermentation-respiration switch protein FrsA (DUF1100 family)